MKIVMQQNTVNKTIEQGFEEFLKYKKANNSKEATIKDYENIFTIFMNFCGNNFYCREINENKIQDYICYLRTKPKKQNGKSKNEKIEYLSNSTIATYIRHLRAVIYYFADRGYTKKFTIKIPVTDEEVKEPYSEEELKLLLQKPDLKKCNFSEYRNWVMTNYFLATGNRLETVRNLKIKDLDFEENEIYLRHVKNRKQYSIPLQQDLKKILLEYLEYRKGEKEDFLFCNSLDDKKPLTNESIKTVMSRYNQKRGVTKTSIHRYRNTFAKTWIIQGGDLIRLQKILGHKTLSMVLKYVDMYSKDLHKNFDYYNALTLYAKGYPISMK